MEEPVVCRSIEGPASVAVPLAAHFLAIVRQRSFVTVTCTPRVDSPEDDSALRGRQNTQPFTISLVSLDSTVEPSSQTSVITLPDMQSARRAAKPCGRIWVSLPVSHERAWVDSFSRTRALQNHLERFVAKRPRPSPVPNSGIEPDI